MKTQSLLTLILTWWTLPLAAGSAASEPLELAGPKGALIATLSAAKDEPLRLSIRRDKTTLLEPSDLGITVDGEDLGRSVRLGPPRQREVHESYPWRGSKSSAINHCIVYEIPVTSIEGGDNWLLEARVFDDGVAYRYRVPGSGTRRVAGESSSWQLPSGAELWYQTDTINYEGNYQTGAAEDIPLRSEDKPVTLGCPVTAVLPSGGFLLLTEAGLYRYSGMSLRPTGTRVLRAAFEDDPEGWEMEGEIVSPWRVTLAAENLNDLVNSDVISSLGEAPDPKLFPAGINTSWIRPGKGLITWAVFMNDGAQWYRQKWFVDMCAAMNCEYLQVDGGWRSERWGFLRDGGDLWGRLAELCEYAATKNVGIFVWHAYPEGRDDGPGLTDPKARRDFFRQCRNAGVKGVKIDFLDSESKEIIEVYEDILRLSAEYQLMINFHGANKPTGEVRTWPHEITREGIREQEYLLWDQLPLQHYGALPFTRMVAGHADFLPTYVRPRYLKNTTAVFQLATAIIFGSPYICWPDHPEAYLESPFLSLIRAMPTVWDETRLLDGNTIGEFVAFARRSGDDWYVAILNCKPGQKDYTLDLGFLGEGDYRAQLYRDGNDGNASHEIETGTQVSRDQSLQIRLQEGGGFVGRFSGPSSYTK